MPSGWTGPRDDTWTWVGQQDGDIGINVNSEIGDDDGDFWDVSTEAFRQNARRHHRDQEGA
jgi:hypothetical protein